MPKLPVKKSGMVRSFNVSPKGNYEGLLLESGDELLQINFPQEWSATLAEIASPGSHVTVEIESRDPHGHPSHSVYELINLSNDKKRKFALHEPNGPGNGHFSGTIERLNYALHGEVNGAILDTGDFLHVKPQGAAALKLTVGMEVKGTGPAKPMVGGHRVIEASEVNGLQLEKKPKPKKKAQH